MTWLNDVHITDVDGSGGMYMLEADLMYEDKDKNVHIAPAGFEGDFSSFPRVVRFFLPVTVLGKAPWLHDYLYKEQPYGSSGAHRKQADRLYREGAKDEGMSKRRANILYLGLRIGGFVTWNGYKLTRNKK